VNKAEREKERRRQQACERLGTAKPVCVTCGEDNPHCLERHHIAAQNYDPAVVQICRNCHRKLSDDQRDHGAAVDEPPSPLERAGHLLLGLADFLALLIEKLREIGRLLICEARQKAAATARGIT
jgi:hypothetical protein